MNNTNTQQGTSAAGAGQEDYVDKGVDALEKKFGGGKVDPVKQRETNEKVTDKARGFLEGKGVHIPKAVSYEPEYILTWTAGENEKTLTATQFSN